MAEQFFAQLDENNVVVNVALVTREFLEANPERYVGRWVETFIDDEHTFGNIGYTYDAVNDVFIAPQPYPSWTLDENFDWQPPTPIPTDGGMYRWNEEELVWAGI
jgi:hypothetical protein